MVRDTTINPLPADQLRWSCPSDYLPFETTEELSPYTGIVGQDRAVEAVRIGLAIEEEGYNLFVTGLHGADRLSVIEHLLEQTRNRDDESPDDICCVNNFKDPDMPKIIYLPAGHGSDLRQDIKEFIESLKETIPQIFESEEYKTRRKTITESLRNRQREIITAFEKKVETENFRVVQIQAGPFNRPALLPVVMGNPMPLEQVESLVEKGEYPKETYERLKEKYQQLSSEMEEIFSELHTKEKDFDEKMKLLDRELVAPLLEQTIEELKKKYDHEKVAAYLDEMQENLLENFRDFLPTQQALPQGQPFMQQQQPQPAEKLYPEYQVNVLVDNAETNGKPVVIEKNPNYRNIFGGIERILDPRYGVWRSDFSRIKAGSLLKANGGYLVINFLDAIFEPGVWQTLMRVLKNQSIEVQSFDPFYFFTTSTMKPEPIKLRTKVILLGDNRLYYMLHNLEQDFKNIFKVKADFDPHLNNEQSVIQDFASYVKGVCDARNMKQLDQKGVAALVEQGVRIAGRQKKFTSHFHQLNDVLAEAHYWALQDNADYISERHVDKAIERREYRVSLLDEKIREMIEDNILMIDTEGALVGQVNGLSVYDMGDYMFGKPSRITAKTSMGRSGIINIEREADLSGKTHNKGVLILSGYLQHTYAQNKPLTMNASICFEQSYGGIDGDSASSTELYAILSSLSGLPLRQDIAVTGSVNQNGEIQPIGGVNQKVEGFFDVCRARNLTGSQGVMIPHQNAGDLMLRKDVVTAVEEGTFHIYPIRTIDEGITLLTGVAAVEQQEDGTFPEGTVHYLVDKKLRDLAEKIKLFVSEDKDGSKPQKDHGCDSCG